MAIKKQESSSRYIEAVGRRKEAIARVRIVPGASETSAVVNGKNLEAYFQDLALRGTALAPLDVAHPAEPLSISVLVKGGGMVAQAHAVRHGLTRAIVKWSAETRPVLKAAGFLTRDPRTRERKKFGLKRARRAPQWKKR
ncbi:MAG: 30S ribosomal protein S9 [Candidatus Wildermuthbacteria bacterium]|nr:30S ribosomal protein S9 [Candidatus Wildermuthbacteria bacterium]